MARVLPFTMQPCHCKYDKFRPLEMHGDTLLDFETHRGGEIKFVMEITREQEYFHACVPHFKERVNHLRAPAHSGALGE